MVEIISRRDGPRREDAALRRIIGDNSATITRLADHLTGGGYSASKAPKQAPKPQGLIIHDLGSARPAEKPHPVVRISLNGRVILVDENSSRQMHHLGEIRSRQGREVFVLATGENGFFAPVDAEIAGMLAELDGCVLEGEEGEQELAAEVGKRLGLP
jgi:hypothetical protein